MADNEVWLPDMAGVEQYVEDYSKPIVPVSGEAEETVATPTKTIGTEFTSVADLNGKTFAIVNKAEGKAICNKQKNAPYDLQYHPHRLSVLF